MIMIDWLMIINYIDSSNFESSLRVIPIPSQTDTCDMWHANVNLLCHYVVYMWIVLYVCLFVYYGLWVYYVYYYYYV